MPASVVALSVQNGSGGYAISHHVADRLGFRYYDWEITSEAAARAGVTPNDVIAAERVPGFLERMMRRLGAVSTVSLEGSFSEPSPATWGMAVQSLTSDDYRQFIERVVAELAERGEAVIVGHAAQFSLRGTPGVLRILIHGSPSLRAERVAEEQGIDLEKAREVVKTSDKDRAEFLKRVYRFDWLDSGMYDLSLNTDHLSVDFAADAIIAATKDFP